MSRVVGAAEAKTKFSCLLDAVGRGEEITISRNGRPAARLIKFDEGQSASREVVIRRIAKRAKKLKLGGIARRELRDFGRKY